MRDRRTDLAVLASEIETFLGARLFEYDPNCVGEANGIVRRVSGKEEYFALTYMYITEVGGRSAVVDHFEQYAGFVLVEPFQGRVDVIVSTGVGVGTADDQLKRS